MKQFKKHLIVVVVIALFFIVTGCSSSNNPDDASQGQNKHSYEGSVVIDGSGSVYPLMAKIAEESI